MDAWSNLVMESGLIIISSFFCTSGKDSDFKHFSFQITDDEGIFSINRNTSSFDKFLLERVDFVTIKLSMLQAILKAFIECKSRQAWIPIWAITTKEVEIQYIDVLSHAVKLS